MLRRSILEIVAACRDESELHWARIKLDLLRNHLADGFIRKVEKALAQRRVELGLPTDAPQREPDADYIAEAVARYEAAIATGEFTAEILPDGHQVALRWPLRIGVTVHPEGTIFQVAATSNGWLALRGPGIGGVEFANENDFRPVAEQ